MRKRTLLSLATLMIAFHGGLVAQEQEAEEARYRAAADWVRLIVEQDFEAAAAQAHEAVAAQLTAEALEGAWGQLEPQLGAIVSLAPKEQGMEQGFHMVVLTGVFDNGTFDVQVFMDDEHAVAGFFVRPPS